MSRKLLVATTIVLSSAFSAFAAYADQTPSSTEMPKDTWLKTVTPLLPDIICKGFIQDAGVKKQMDDNKITYEQCVTVMPTSITKCQNDLYSSLPDTLNKQTSSTWGQALAECIGKDFAQKYLVKQ